jgi:hypothetical protein
VKGIQARTRVRRVIATSIKEYLPPVLRILFTLFKEKKEGHAIGDLRAVICGCGTSCRPSGVRRDRRLMYGRTIAP